MTDDYVMELHRQYREEYEHAEVDVSSGNDLARSEETSEFDVVEYHLPAIEQPTQFVSYVATIVPDDVVETYMVVTQFSDTGSIRERPMRAY